MSYRSRRATAALTSAIALTAGLIGAFGTGTAEAATAGPANGVIAYQAPNGSVHFVNADGTNDRVFSALPAGGSGSISWSSDGSRVALSGYGTVSTVKVDGSAAISVPSGQTVATSDGVYGGESGLLVSDDGHKIYRQSSDGANAVALALPAADEPGTVSDSQPVLSVKGVYAFTRNWGTMTSIMTYNPATKAINEVAKNASNPSFSADGSTILYQQNLGGTDQIGIVDTAGGNQRTLTADPAGANRPSLSPDGTKLVYGSYDSTRGNVVKLLDLSSATTTVLANGQAPSWQPLRKAVISHVYGVGGVSNDAAASRWQFSTLGHYTPGLLWAKNAVLANKGDTTDAALGVALAAEKQGPLLLTSGGSLDAAAAADLKRALVHGSTVYLEGSTSELSNTVVTQVQRLGFKVVRVTASGGASGQSVASAWNIAHTPNWVFVADAQDYRVAASAASMAASAGYGGRSVVLLNTGWSLPSTLTGFFNRSNPTTTNVVAIGNHSIYAMEHTPLRQGSQWKFWTLTGSDPEYLSYDMAKFWWGSPYLTTLANTSDWRSGFAGASVNAGYGPLLWTSATGLDPVDKLYLQQESAGATNAQIFGTGWPTATVNAIAGALGATPSWTELMQDPNGTIPAMTSKVAGLSGPSAGSRGQEAPHGAALGVLRSGTTG
ncbi:TolB family protein [Streptacidiphilus melanogenes]|uniref:TolB family protein n=1 Tax=Streptacidiphilus melanogenes TaxID=411235 RepID=UPI0005A9132A|nr:PD40 domain-containing protein [Streptacidiphilus melanogenes]